MTEGSAIVYCQDAFLTPNGKTAHGLVRFTRRYDVLCVIDRQASGKDAGEVLYGAKKSIPIVASLDEALAFAESSSRKASHFVVGLAPDGGRLGDEARNDVSQAIKRGLHVDCGLHDFLTDDPTLQDEAKRAGVRIRDIRKPPDRSDLHFFSGKIEDVTSFRIAVLGTDSAVGKRTTAWRLVESLEKAGRSVQMIGTGQTAWLQGAKHSLVLDSLVNDFVSGEIEHAVWSAWDEHKPDFIVIEGQGSLLNPAYPGGFEILAAGRPHAVIMQHAPARKEYDGFPGFAMHPLPRQIEAVEMVSGTPVVAITLNHEQLDLNELGVWCRALETLTGLPTVDVLVQGADRLAAEMIKIADSRNGGIL